jgi:hypothetical protein
VRGRLASIFRWLLFGHLGDANSPADAVSAAQLKQWNDMVLSLNQALIGAVSLNFRIVWISRSGDAWRLHFVLEKDDPVDREEIEEDMATNFWIYAPRPPNSAWTFS